LEWQFDRGDEVATSTLQGELMARLRRDGDPDGDFDAAELIVGELMSNIVRHARSPIRVRLDWSSDFPRLTVAESDRYAHPPIELPSDPLAESGRGLFIVQALAKDFAVVDDSATGTQAQATLPIRRRTLEPPRRDTG
jgi:anti-sigma regulatory factor (Ser/Thr protein kinase)